MKILWTHNFNPNISNSGIFMYALVDGLRALGVKVTLRYLGNLRSVSAIYNASREIRVESKSYDVVHAQYGSACAFATSFSTVPTVVSLRGSDWHVSSGVGFWNFGHNSAARMLTLSRLASFGKIIVMSNRMSRELTERTGLQDIEIIPDAIDTQKFFPRDRAESRRRFFDDPDNGPWALFTSLDEKNPIKRVSLAKEAVNRAKIALPDLRLRVASGIRHELMPHFVNCCDIVLCTSTHEGWPNSIKEGLACGLPFVSTDVSDLGEIATTNRTCEVAADQVEALAASLVKVLSIGPVDRLNLVATAERMSVPKTCVKILKLYLALLNGAWHGGFGEMGRP